MKYIEKLGLTNIIIGGAMMSQIREGMIFFGIMTLCVFLVGFVLFFSENIERRKKIK